MRASAEQRITENRYIRRLFGTTAGVQIKRIRRPRKRIPEWARNENALRGHVLTPALRRYRVAYLYYLVGQSAREIAEELETTVGAIQSIIRKLNRAHT